MTDYTEVDRNAAVRLHRKGWGYLKISQVIGCAPSTARKWILKAGVDTHSRIDHAKDTRAKAIEFYVAHPEISMKKVAVKHGVYPATLSKWLCAEGVARRPHRPRMVSKEGILSDLKLGYSKKDIAQRNNCSESWVYRIQRGDW